MQVLFSLDYNSLISYQSEKSVGTKMSATHLPLQPSRWFISNYLSHKIVHLWGWVRELGYDFYSRPSTWTLQSFGRIPTRPKLFLRLIALWHKLCCQLIKETLQVGEWWGSGYWGQTHMLFHWPYLLLRMHYGHISNSLLQCNWMQITVCWCYDSKVRTVIFISINTQNYWLQRWMLSTIW